MTVKNKETIKKLIEKKLLGEKKYLVADYTARKLAEETGINQRYLSEVLRQEFNANYASLVNGYRVKEAIKLLSDSHFRDLSIEDIGDKVGFAYRQTFYAAFVRFTGTTPRAFRLQQEQMGGD